MVDSVAPTGLPVPHGVNLIGPTASRYALVVNSDGSINVTGSSSANASVGLNNATAPTSSTEIGLIDGTGKLQGVSALNPLPVSGSFSASFSEPVLNFTGTISSAAVLSNFPVTDMQGYRTAVIQVTVLGAGNTIILEESNDGTTWTGIQTASDTGAVTTALTAVGEYIFPVSAKQLRARCSVYATGASTVNAELRQNPPGQIAVAIRGIPSFKIDQTTPGTTNLVSVSNFPATVDTNTGAAGASTLRVVLANSQTVGLVAGVAIVGKFGIDQTTPGTTNAVAATNLPATVDTNTGAAGASTLRVALANSSTVGLVAGSALVGKVGIDQTTPGTTNAVAPDVSGFASGAASATGTSDTQIIAAVSSKRLYIHTLSISNSSATDVVVTIKDGSAGATLWVCEVPAGGGTNIAAGVPFLRTTSGTGLFFASSSGVSTIYANAGGYSQ